MPEKLERALSLSSAAAAVYLATFVARTGMAVRRGHKAAALGIRTPLPISLDVAVGMGTALAAPWPLIVWLWRARAEAASPGREGRRARAQLAVLGALFLAGAVAEPISHRLFEGRLGGIEAAIASLNLALAGLIVTGAAASLVAANGEKETG